MTPPRAALCTILLLAAALRIAGLGWGLRHTPHWDERVFVENARAMVVEGSLDHRYYEYPGLFFYVLFPILLSVPEASLQGAGAYLVVRGVVAAFGIASVGLVYRLASRRLGAGAGLAAALLLAVSPNEVFASHMVRPDVVLGTFVLLAFLAFERMGAAARGDLVAGAAVGAATAVKFTGALLVPSYLAARLLAPGARVRGAAVAGLAAALVAVAATPYALIHAEAYREGLGVQWTAHYKGRALAPSYLEQLRFYLGVVVWSFGPLGAGLVAVGTARAARAWRTWAPLLAHPVATLCVLATAELRYERHLIPTSGLLAVLAGSAVAAVAGRWPRAALPLTLLAALPPLATSFAYARGVSGPMTKDGALDWIEAHAAPGSRILTLVPDLGLDGRRVEVLKRPEWGPEARLLARDADLVVSHEPEELAGRGLETLALFTAERRYGGAALAVARARPAPAYERIRVAPRRLSASESREALPAVVDGRLDTKWTTVGPQRPQAWIQVDFEAAVPLARVELVVGDRPGLQAGYLQLHGTADGTRWERLRVVEGRAAVEEQVEPPVSQVLLLEPVELRGVRIVQVGRRRRPWGVAELRLDALPGGS